MNFAEKLINAGYSEVSRVRIWGNRIPKSVFEFNPSHGWLGVTSYSPYAELQRGNKKVVIEIGCTTKVISFFIGRYCAYNTMFGIMPPETVVKYFLEK